MFPIKNKRSPGRLNLISRCAGYLEGVYLSLLCKEKYVETAVLQYQRGLKMVCKPKNS